MPCLGALPALDIVVVFSATLHCSSAEEEDGAVEPRRSSRSEVETLPGVETVVAENQLANLAIQANDVFVGAISGHACVFGVEGSLPLGGVGPILPISFKS